MKIKIGVLFGGKSVEHEVSIISAVQACYAFDREKYEVVPIYMTRDNRFYTGEALGKIETYRSGVEAMLKSTPGITQVQMVPEEGRLWLERYPQRRFGSNRITDIDVVFPIVHGTNVEDGALQGYLKTLGVPFVGCDVLASAVGMDKYVMKMLWQAAGLPVVP